MVAGLPDEVAILRSPTDAVTKLGSDEATSVLTPEFLSLVPGFFAADVVARPPVHGLAQFASAVMSRRTDLRRLSPWVPDSVRQS